MLGLLPPLGTRGSFTVGSPFTLNDDYVYTCSAHRSLNQMVRNGDDPLQTIYLDNGLTEADFNLALQTDVFIVTLITEMLAPINIPSSHITSYDNGSYVDHQFVVVTAACGLLPTTFDKTRIKESVQSALFEYTGIAGEVYVVVKDTDKRVSEAEAEAAANARQAAIEYNSNNFKDKLTLAAENQRLRDENQRLIEVIEGLQNSD